MACFSKFRVALMGAAAVSGLLMPAAIAQEATTGTASMIDPNAGFNSPDGGSDLFSDPNAPLDLIHRAILMNNMSLTEFRQQQQQRISNEAANFRQRQQEALRQQPAAASTEAAPEDGDL